MEVLFEFSPHKAASKFSGLGGLPIILIAIRATHPTVFTSRLILIASSFPGDFLAYDVRTGHLDSSPRDRSSASTRNLGRIPNSS